jgi:Cytochrome bd terminal oxidase subunit I
MAYEGLMAFFLEASFLGVLLFGRRLVPTWAHFFAAVMVAAGTFVLFVLDPGDELVDADAARLSTSTKDSIAMS